ncbi:hypothetical protein GF357_01255 [Candidatus Dojkabacteria bacterium]|nr:hypothetical protein [Candidatus Dojkabacteria bacterium]
MKHEFLHKIMNQPPIKATLNSVTILIIAFIAVMPFLTIINLTPETRQEFRPHVLGVQAQNVSLVDGQHEYIRNEKLDIKDSNLAIYSAVITARNSGTYSKPIVTLANDSNTTKKYKVFTTGTLKSTTSKLGVIVNETNYILLSGEENTPYHMISVKPSSSVEVYLRIENSFHISYDESISIDFLEVSDQTQ